MNDEVIWVEKYRPQTIKDCILPKKLKDIFLDYVENKKEEIPNMLFVGRAGTGKTSVARALLNEIDVDIKEINGSLDRNIDTVRYQIKEFAESISFTGKRKFVIIDEADNLNPTAQLALRNFIEKYSENCGFIFTANFGNKIIEPLHSRMATYHFDLVSDNRNELLKGVMIRCIDILKKENVKFNPKVLGEFVKKYFPDLRKTINELQKIATHGDIDESMLININEDNFSVLVEYLKEKEFSKMREWVGENQDTDQTILMRKFYDKSKLLLKPESIPVLILHISEYQYKSNFVADQEINTVAFLTEVMRDCVFV